jgi:hypothetical protein
MQGQGHFRTVTHNSGMLRNRLEHFGTLWNTLEHFGTLWNTLEQVWAGQSSVISLLFTGPKGIAARDFGGCISPDSCLPHAAEAAGPPVLAYHARRVRAAGVSLRVLTPDRSRELFRLRQIKDIFTAKPRTCEEFKSRKSFWLIFPVCFALFAPSRLRNPAFS